MKLYSKIISACLICLALISSVVVAYQYFVYPQEGLGFILGYTGRHFVPLLISFSLWTFLRKRKLPTFSLMFCLCVSVSISHVISIYETSGEKIYLGEHQLEFENFMTQAREKHEKRVLQFNEDIADLYQQYTAHALQNPEKRKMLQDRVVLLDSELEDIYRSEKSIWKQGRSKKLKSLPKNFSENPETMEKFDIEMDEQLSACEAGYKKYKEILNTYLSLIEFLNVRKVEYFVEDDTLFFTSDFDLELYNFMYEKLYRMLEES